MVDLGDGLVFDPVMPAKTIPSFAVVLLMSVGPAMFAAEWSQFRGPNGSAVAPESNPPTTWSATSNLVWKTPLEGAGTSSPIVWRDQVYLTSHTGYGMSASDRGQMEALKRHVLCFSLADGKLLWQREVPAELPETQFSNRMEWHGYASSTPAANADGVYCFFGKSGVHAFSHQGEPLWKTSVGTGTHGWGSAASPILVGDLVIVNAFSESEAVVALDRKTGAERWRRGGLKDEWDTPVIVQPKGGKPELALGIFGELLGLDPATGDELWSCDTVNWYVVGSPVVKGDIVYVLSGKGVEAATAVRAGGKGDVTTTHRVWQAKKGSNVSSPVLFNDRLYFAHDQGSFFYCLNATSGEVVYQERLPGRFGFVYSSPVIAGGKIYLFSRDGSSVVIKAGDAFEVLAQNQPLDKSPINASPAVVGDRLLIRSDAFLYCIGER